MIIYIENLRKKAPRTNKRVEPHYRIHGQYTKVSHISMYEQQSIGNLNYKNNTIYNSSKKEILRQNLTKYVQDLYTENDKTPMKEILKDLNKWRHTTVTD